MQIIAVSYNPFFERKNMNNFEKFSLSPSLNASLKHMKYTNPTPIQVQAIPLALKGRDIMGSAQTGTGKTGAFSIPLVEAILRSEDDCALVLTPTRELGKQVMEVITQLLGPKSHINTAFIIGGESMGKQFSQLKRNPRIVVGTPGRINDHLERGSLKLDKTNFLVLDETDRMLDMGFSVQIDRIVKHIPNERQTLMFSATLPKNIINLSSKYLNNPERIAVGSTIAPAKNIKRQVIHITNEGKYNELIRQLDDRKGSVIIFVKTKHGTERLAKRLRAADHSAEAIHGDLKQRRRDRVITEFRDKKYRILVATDVAARGLDIPHIEHVVNYDLPQVPEDYIHRIGRTARAGAEGASLCFVSPEEGRKWYAIEMLINPDKKMEKPPADPSKKSRRKPNRGKVTNHRQGGKPSNNNTNGKKRNFAKKKTRKAAA